MNEEEILIELHAEHPIDELIKFSEMDIQEKLQQNSFMVVKYKELYHKELANLDKLEMLMEKLIGERYKYYRFEDDRGFTKPEIERYCLPSDEKIVKMKKIINRQMVRVRFFDACWRGFDKQGWSMKSFIDTLKGGY